MKTAFSPKPKKAVADISAVQNVNENLYIFRAFVSSNLNRKAAVATALNEGGLQLAEKAAFVIDKNHGTPIVEGFALASPASRVIDKKEFASTVENMGIREIARNMYMDDDEVVWHVTAMGDELVITKDENNEVEALLASVQKHQHNSGFIPLVNKKSPPGIVAWCNNSGYIEGGIMYEPVRGREEYSRLLRFENIKGKPVDISNYSVIAYKELENLDDNHDFDNLDPVDYYEVVYSEDPEMIDTLETLAKSLTLL